MAIPKRRGNLPPQGANGRDHDATETTSLLDPTIDPATDQLASVAADDADTSGRWAGYDDFDGLTWWRKPSVVWLLGPYAVFTLAFGGMIVPKINLILDLVCRRYFANKVLADPTYPFTPVVLGIDNPQCRIPEVQSNVASFMLATSLITGGLSAITAPRLGHLSDRWGRRHLLAVASCGGLLNELITILAAKYPDTVEYRWLILGAAFDGLAGSFTAGSILCQSYTSDCTPPSKRAVSVGYLHACLFTGLALGPILAGYFAEWTGSLISVFYLVLCCHLFFVFCMAFVIPESLSKRKQLVAREKYAKEKEARASQLGSWLSVTKVTNPFAVLSVLWPTGRGTSSKLRINLVALAISDAIILGTAMSVGQVLILYSEYTFEWGNLETSRFISALSLVRVIILMGLFPLINYFGRTRPAVRRLRETGVVVVDKNSGADRLDIWILRIAVLSDVVGCVGYIFARSESLFFASGMMTALGGMGSATVQAVVTKHVPPERTGQVLGAIGMLYALSRVIGPVLFNGLYARTVKSFPQAFLVLLLSLFMIALVATFVVRPGVHWEEDQEEYEEEETDPLIAAERVIGSRAVGTLPIGENPTIVP